MNLKMYKNLFQFISSLGVILVIDISLICGFIISLNSSPNNGWILIIIALVILILYFLIGSFWIFQKIIINDDGLKIVILNIVLFSCKLEEIEFYSITNVMKNPSVSIKVTNRNKMINIDKKKKLLSILEYYNINKQ